MRDESFNSDADDSRKEAPNGSASSTPSSSLIPHPSSLTLRPSLLDELANVAVYKRGLFVNDPVRAIRDSLYGQLGNELIKPDEIARKQRRVLLSPYHERRHFHFKRGEAYTEVRPVLVLASGWRADARGAIVI